MKEQEKKNWNYISCYIRKSGRVYHLVFEAYLKGKKICKSRSSKTENKEIAESMLPEFELEWKKYFKITETKEITSKNKFLKSVKQDANLYDSEISFCDFVYGRYKAIDDSTYAGYMEVVKNSILPYFYKLKLLMKNINTFDIQRYYFHEMMNIRGVSGNTVIHYHNLLSLVFKYAMKLGIITTNPLLSVEKPKKTKYIAKTYTHDEIKVLLEKIKAENFKLYCGVVVASYFGLRRSEVLGLKWSAIDLVNGIMSITHTVTETTINGKRVVIAKDKTKNTTSMRSFAIPEALKEIFLEMKEKQNKNKEYLGRDYSTKDEDYICVNDGGVRLSPNFLTREFAKFLKKHNMTHIRFHDLRHSCASILCANNVSVKDIQMYLGHSSAKTTMDTYVHLLNKSNINTVNVISDKLRD